MIFQKELEEVTAAIMISFIIIVLGLFSTCI
jgi:hypothetical protein